ncbi:hypothetical protein HHI36_010470 [Cryptolaemus montrouzieri]|uniref:Uncharacterized protein n=1 Tax=Cryptolaemus montrouzieri TaxID=559131 RepID=A0ABD2MJ11_9CUCU
MNSLILVVAILGVSNIGASENREKRGLISSLGYGIDSSLSSLSASSLSLPLSASVISSPSILSSPTIIKTVEPLPIVKTVVAPQYHVIKAIAPQPLTVSYVSAPAISLAPSLSLSSHSLGSYSSLPSVSSGGLLKSYKWGGIPVTSYKTW